MSNAFLNLKNEIQNLQSYLSTNNEDSLLDEITSISKLHAVFNEASQLRVNSTTSEEFQDYFRSLIIPVKSIISKYNKTSELQSDSNLVIDNIKKNAKNEDSVSSNKINESANTTVREELNESTNENKIKQKRFQRREILFQLFLAIEKYELLTKEILKWEEGMNLNTIYKKSFILIKKIMKTLTILLDPPSFESFSAANFHFLLSKLCELYPHYKFTFIKDLCIYFEADIKSLLNIDPENLDEKLDGRTTIDYQVGKRKHHSLSSSTKTANKPIKKERKTNLTKRPLKSVPNNSARSSAVSSLFQTVTISQKKK